MIAACFFVLSIFGVNLVNANELNVDQFGTDFGSIDSDFIDEVVNIGANFKQAAQPTLEKTLHALATDNIDEVTRSLKDIISSFANLLDNLKNDKSDSSQDVSIPALDIAANSKTIGQIQTAMQNIIKLNGKVKAASASFKIVDGKLYATKAQLQQVLSLLKALAAQYQALKVALADFKEDLLNVAVAVLQDNDNAYGPYLFKNIANDAAATSKAYSAIVASLDKTIVDFKLLLSTYNKNGIVFLPAAKPNANLNGLLTNIGDEWDSMANALAILKDKIEASN